MKIAKKLSLSRAFRTNRKGVALVTVLTVMSLTTILVLTFFTLATSEHRASKTYSQGLQAQQVAEQAVNMVVAQIREATSVGVTKAWASQPGAIRTWDEDGNFDTIYKLYSDDEMKSTREGQVSGDYNELNNWSQKPAHFVDLNEPVIRGEKVYYPIVDPTAANIPKWKGGMADKERDSDFNNDGVEGFKYKLDFVEEGEFGKEAAGIYNATEGHVPMPVKWIYQLADGTLGFLDGASSGGGAGSYKFEPITGSSIPSEKNQIVARFAFWADDESTKLNVNTHAGGAAWDLPRAGGILDRTLAKFQPAKNEWQRYPGHPATTHLSPALSPGYVINLGSLREDGDGKSDREKARDALEMLYKVAPRIIGGGSESGTRQVDPRNRNEGDGLRPDTDPLYPSIDDLVMRADRRPHAYPDGSGNAISEHELGEYIERSKFFVTAYSRSPEVNMFNLPKVAMWPIFDAERNQSEYQSHLTPFDRLIHYCASVGGSRDDRFDYIFKRRYADHPTYDLEDIPRNKELYAYLEKAMSTKVPGYGSAFNGKYSQDYQQILTQIFDYIRCTNVHDDTVYGDRNGGGNRRNNDNSHRTFTNWRSPNGKQGLKGHGQVIPIEHAASSTKGFGRFYTLASVQVLAIGAGQPFDINGSGDDVGRFPGYVGANDEDNLINDIQEAPSGTVFLNLPPMPNSVKKGEESTQPEWLKALKGTPEYDAAFQREDWNWQLAFLYDPYKNAVLSDPGANKFAERWLNETGPGTYEEFYKAPDASGMRLAGNERLVQGALLFNLFTPSVGWNAINPDMEIEISAPSGGLTFASLDQGNVGFLGFEGYGMGGGNTYVWATNWVESAQGSRRFGGLMPFGYALNARGDVISAAAQAGGWNYTGSGVFGGGSRATPIDRAYSDLVAGVQSIEGASGRKRQINNNASDVARAYTYDLVTIPFKVGDTDLAFDGGDLEFKFFPGRDFSEATAHDKASTDEVQTITVKIPRFTAEPAVVRFAGEMNFGPMMGRKNANEKLVRDSFGFLERASITQDPANPRALTAGQKVSVALSTPNSGAGHAWGRIGQTNARRSSGRAVMFGPGDVVQSVEVNHGDMRVIAAQKEIGSGEYFVPHQDYDSQKVAHSLTNSMGNAYWGFTRDPERLIVTGLSGNNPYRNRAPLPFGEDRSDSVQLYGDFDNGVGLMIDGPYINKPDEGNVSNLLQKIANDGGPSGLDPLWDPDVLAEADGLPYFTQPWRIENGGAAYFSPNRLVSGPGMFGSLPTTVKSEFGSNRGAWRTLLFRPSVSGGNFEHHPGRGAEEGGEGLPDHLLMDLFWMPVVEPYAISEPLSTAGKINMNYQMAPFLHIHRSTALRGVFRSEYMSCIPKGYHQNYKHNRGLGRKTGPQNFELMRRMMRSVIQDTETLKQFDEYFGDGDKIFKSATEICDIHLVPYELAKFFDLPKSVQVNSLPDSDTITYKQMSAYWNFHSLVGDNSRERPYANIHQRLTTKSNTFKVHYRAQVLKQSRREDDDEYQLWRPEVDSVQGEYRGSSIVERFVDPHHPDLPDFAQLFADSGLKLNPDDGETLDQFYQYRVVNPRRFAP